MNSNTHLTKKQFLGCQTSKAFDLAKPIAWFKYPAKKYALVKKPQRLKNLKGLLILNSKNYIKKTLGTICVRMFEVIYSHINTAKIYIKTKESDQVAE